MVEMSGPTRVIFKCEQKEFRFAYFRNESAPNKLSVLKPTSPVSKS